MKTTNIKNVKMKKPAGGKYDKDQLKEGGKVESEHTTNKQLKETIAKNHLDEDKDYYKKLKKIEKKKGKK